MSTTATSKALADMAEQVIKALDRSPEPRTFFQLQRALPRPYQGRTDELRQILQDQVAKGRVHQFAPYRSKAPRYWTRDLEHHARRVILRTLGKGGVTRPALLRKVRTCLQGLSDDRLREVLDEMLNDGHVRQLPPVPGGRANPLRAGAPVAADYLVPVFRTFARSLNRVLLLLESEGITREQALEEAQALWEQTLAQEQDAGAAEDADGDEDAGSDEDEDES